MSPDAGPQKSNSSQSGRSVFWPLWVAPGILLFCGVAVGVVLLAGCGGESKPPAEPPPKPAEAPPPPKPIQLAPLSPLKLDPGGRATVALQVERNGNEGAIQVAFEGAPEGISITPREIAAGESAGQLEVAAAEKLGDQELKATVRVTVKVGDLEAEQPLELTVNKVNLPSFAPVANVILQPGATATVDLTVNRNEYQGPLELRVGDLPEKIAATVQSVAAGQSATKVEITAAADVPDGAKTLRVAATVYGRPVEVQIPLQIDRQPFLVKSFMVVMLKPGETKQVQVPVERRSYKGPLTLEITDLPEGVTVPKVQLAPDQAAATLQVAATADAQEGVHSAKVVSTGGDFARTDPLVVRVSYGESGFLPRVITADPEAFPLFRRGSFGGRLSAESKQALVTAYGGTPQSEEAVLRGLRWLAAHQRADGGWSLKEYWKDVPRCDCYSEFEKEVDVSDTAATAFGVLAFLGAGIAHNGGPERPLELVEYRKRVFSAVAFLTKNQVVSKEKSSPQTTM